MILPLYVGDLFVTCAYGLVADTKRKLAAKFEMKELGMMHYFLGMGCGRMRMESPWDKGSMQRRS